MIALYGCTKILRTDRQQTIVFDSVDVAIPRDGVTVILGARGAGKTTLIRLLAGSVGPTDGRIDRSCHVSFPLGSLGRVHKKQTARELVGHIAFLYGQDRRTILGFLERIPEIGILLDEYVLDLPGPNRTKLSYAVAFSLSFDMYVIDTTPMVGGEAFQRFCSVAIEERRRSCGVVLATSAVRHASSLADRVMVIHERKLIPFRDKEAGIAFFSTSMTRAREREKSLYQN